MAIVVITVLVIVNEICSNRRTTINCIGEVVAKVYGDQLQVIVVVLKRVSDSGSSLSTSIAAVVVVVYWNSL